MEESSADGYLVAEPPASVVAEFSALRDEINTRIGLQFNVLSLQLTTSGAIFGLVLSKPELYVVLLIVPLSSYLFAGAYQALDAVIVHIARYIDSGLGRGSALGWEAWKSQQLGLKPQKQQWPFRILVHPFLLAFPGVTLLALGGTVGSVLADGRVLGAKEIIALAAVVVGIGVLVGTWRTVWPLTKDLAELVRARR